MHWFQKTAEGGNIHSMFNLGYAYQQGFDEKADLKMTMHFGLRDDILNALRLKNQI
jgi:TPR repeat protein